MKRTRITYTPACSVGEFPTILLATNNLNQMTTKKYLSHAKNELHYFDLVSRSVLELSPLRDDQRKTEAYLTRYLFADARLRESEGAELRENEVDPALAPAVRRELLHVIEQDDSFHHARTIILQGAHGLRMPDVYSELLHDPPAPGPYKGDEWQTNEFNLSLEIFNQMGVRKKLEQLLGAFLKQNELWRNSQHSAKEVEKLRKALQESGKRNEALKEELALKECELEKLRKVVNDEAEGDVMTVSQLVLFFVYFFGELDVHMENSHKTEWARLIHRISGKSEQRIRNAFQYDFDNKHTKKISGSLPHTARSCSPP